MHKECKSPKKCRKLHKNKGSALILTIAVVMLLTVLATCLLTLASNQNILTANVYNRTKLRYVAESGIYRGKEALNQNVSINGNTPNINSVQNISFKDYNDTVTCDVTFDISDKNNMKITSVAKEGTKQLELHAVVDGSPLTKIQYFNSGTIDNALSVIDDGTDTSQPTLSVASNSLQYNGNVYIQANKVVGSDFRKNSLVKFQDTNTGSNIFLWDTNLGDASIWRGLASTDKSYKLPSVKWNQGQVPSSTPTYSEKWFSYRYKTDYYIDSDEIKTLSTRVLLVKVRGNKGQPIDFKQLQNKVLQDNPFVLQDQIPGDNIKSILRTVFYWRNYPLVVYMIDGDVNVNSSGDRFSNLVIYCTGSMNINGDVKFDNAAVTCNKLKLVGNGNSSEFFKIDGDYIDTHNSSIEHTRYWCNLDDNEYADAGRLFSKNINHDNHGCYFSEVKKNAQAAINENIQATIDFKIKSIK